MASTNAGLSWKKNRIIDSLLIDGIAVDRTGHIFAASYTKYGVFRSTDNGFSWNRVGLSNQYGINAVVVDSSCVILAASHADYVWRSTDDGTTWSRSATSGILSSRCYALAIAANGDAYVAGEGGIARSTDHGAIWITIKYTMSSYCLAIRDSNEVFVGHLANKGTLQTTNRHLTSDTLPSNPQASIRYLPLFYRQRPEDAENVWHLTPG